MMPLISSNNKMIVRFTSDGSNQFSGYKLKFNSGLYIQVY